MAARARLLLPIAAAAAAGTAGGVALTQVDPPLPLVALGLPRGCPAAGHGETLQGLALNKGLGIRAARERLPLAQIAWMGDLAAGADAEAVFTANSMCCTPTYTNHLFTTYVQTGMLSDLICYYYPSERRVVFVVQLGSGSCGYPRILHGGMTAAVLDEAFGFLFLSLRRHGQLPFLAPAFTAHLEVAYHKKIQASAGRLLMVTCDVERIEGRKVFMCARLQDRPGGATFATSKAVFVAPKLRRLVSEGARYVASAATGGIVSF